MVNPSDDTAPAGASDQHLLNRFRRGEEDAATAIYLRYAKRLLMLARSQSGKDLTVRIDPEDIVQSVFRTFFRRAREGHYEIPDGEELWKLFLVIALNKVRKLGGYHRAAKRDVSQTTALEQVGEQAGQQQLDHQSYEVLRMTIEGLLQELSQSQRTIVSMRIDGYDIATIAATTGRARRSVERILQQFRIRLAEVLREE